MTIRRLADARRRELQAFFKQRFGRYWHREVCKLLSAAYRGYTLSRNSLYYSTRALDECDLLAEKLGFVSPSLRLSRVAVERNFIPVLTSLVQGCRDVKMAHFCANCVTLAHVLYHWAQFKRGVLAGKSDVISPDLLEFLTVEPRILSPRREDSVTSAPGLEDLLNFPLTNPPCRARPEGGQKPPPNSLNAPRADSKTPRTGAIDFQI